MLVGPFRASGFGVGDCIWKLVLDPGRLSSLSLQLAMVLAVVKDASLSLAPLRGLRSLTPAALPWPRWARSGRGAFAGEFLTDVRTRGWMLGIGIIDFRQHEPTSADIDGSSTGTRAEQAPS